MSETFSATEFLRAQWPGEFPAGLRGAVVAIGNFDGVHRGHRAVLQQALALARSEGAPCAVLTFEPHPRAFFTPHDPPFRLSDETEKARLIAALGLDGLITARFDAALVAMSAEDFIQTILKDWLAVKAVVVGEDFCFGSKRKGNVDLLRASGIRVEALRLVGEEGKAFSSTAIRDALGTGDMQEAARLLGHPYAVSGEVLHGKKIGRTLGFPTANMRLADNCPVPHGIYAVQALIDGVWHDGVASFGRRPTFDNGAPLLETFVFDFSGDLYGKTIEIAFIGRIRGEEKFDSLDALIVQMNKDSETARHLIAKAGQTA